MWPLILLATVPGLGALAVYYYGLRATPASRATIAELAFPTTAAFVGVVLLDSHLTTSQWVGIAIVVAAVLAMGWHERRAPLPAVAPGAGSAPGPEPCTTLSTAIRTRSTAPCSIQLRKRQPRSLPTVPTGRPERNTP